MRDIVTRLRTWTHAVDAVLASDLMDEAAREIEQLRSDWPEQLTAHSVLIAEQEMKIERLRGDIEIAKLRLKAAHGEIERLSDAIRRLADQDATLSVVGGNVIVQMDATLTDAERWAVKYFAAFDRSPRERDAAAAATLRGLLERLGGGE